MQRSRSVLQDVLARTEQRCADWTPTETRKIIVPLYRRLLRECTYVPDAHARKWIRDEAAYQFRRGHPVSAKPKDSHLERLQDRLSRAKKSIVFIQRANAGEPKAYKKIIELSYGLVGRRRRQLLAPILPNASDQERLKWLRRNGTPEDRWQDALAAMSRPEKLSQSSNYFPPISSLLRAVGESQIQSRVSSHTGKLRRIEPRIPAENSWFQPFPEKRKRNMMEAGYAAFLDKLQVPIPEADHRRLLRIATAQIPIKLVQKRAGLEEHTLAETGFLVTMTAIDKPGTRARLSQPLEQRRFPTRSLRRIYQKVLLNCPRVSWNAERKRWDVKWGMKIDPV